MLQPRTYPELIGKALVLETEPFVVMAEDDNPWVEGLFLTACLGFLVGVARVVGSWLTVVSLPSPDAVLTTLLQGWRQWSTAVVMDVDAALVERGLREVWAIVIFWSGLSGGWLRLLTFVTTPLGFIVQWMLAGLIIFGVARALGGTGTLNQTLGVTALMVAPNLFAFASFIPFVGVSTSLVLVWAMLIGYRAIEVAHGLPWQRAMLAALSPLLLLLLLLLLLVVFISSLLFMGSLA